MESQANPEAPHANEEKPYLAQMDFFRGRGKNMRRIRVRFYPTETEEDERPFIAKTLEGTEVVLRPKEIDSAKPLIFRKR